MASQKSINKNSLDQMSNGASSNGGGFFGLARSDPIEDEDANMMAVLIDETRELMALTLQDLLVSKHQLEDSHNQIRELS